MIFLLSPVIILGYIKNINFAVKAGCVYLGALLFSPIPPYYIYSGAIEVQAGVVAGIFIAMLARAAFKYTHNNQKIIIVSLVLSGFMIPLYKDTAAIVIGLSFLIFQAACLLFPSKFNSINFNSQANKRIIVLGFFSLFSGIVIAALYNFVKYGSLLPVAYINIQKATSPALSKSIEFFVGSIFSPNGGVLIFWLFPFFLFFLSLRNLRFSFSGSVVWIGAIAALISCVGFSLWWAPFGWVSWGNRLMIPPMLAIMVAVFLSLDSDEVQSPIKPFLRVSLFLSPALLLSFYYFLVPHLSQGYNSAIGYSIFHGEACKEQFRVMPDESKRIGLNFFRGNHYYKCVREIMLHFPYPR